MPQWIMPLVIIMHECSPGELLASAAFMRHDDPMGLRHFQRVGMMHQCSTGKLLAGAALAHHDDKCHLLVTCQSGMCRQNHPHVEVRLTLTAHLYKKVQHCWTFMTM